MSNELVLFCPFCRESFEGRTTCPEHELPLVSWTGLAPELTDDPNDSVVLASYDMRRGRWLVAFGAILTLVGFVSPVLRTSLSDLDVSGDVLASTRAGNLWTAPLVATVAVALVFRARTLAALRAVRVAVSAGALVGVASLAFTTYRLLHTAAFVQERTGRTIEITPLYGAYVMLTGLVVLFVGGARLGAD